MKKLFVLIVSGPDDPAKVKAGLGFARVAKDSGQVDDVQCCFLADGVDVLVPENLMAFESLFNAVIDRNIFVIACQLHAEQKGIQDQLRDVAHIDLHYVGKDMVDALTQGYEFVTF